ncbi:adenosine-specific kinase [Leptolyngbya sp. CCNP1308]|uniref:adenosine-specific kinase n=1 Tax=Leptolyngbya sp. CCNP1308 TaxID=3110255 RepID=UPI002B210157|nr:adenosine-specific kinase [Leptolyngbya sp. CCNP1308]MEA5449131.1 adenosine-specific kinase [Leptolyngbya sp. CCNP1308]
MELQLVDLELPPDSNLILGQSHFIKTVEDLYEVMIAASAQVQFGLAFCEASGPCLIRAAGNNPMLEQAAIANAEAIAAGHSFVILMQQAFPISVLNVVKQCPEVCHIYCATANPVQVVIAASEQGRGILGVIDGSAPKGVEGPEDVRDRQQFLRQIGYKLG